MGRGLRRIALPPFRSTGHPWLVAATVLATLAACKEAARPAPVATIAMTRALDSVYVGGTRQVGVSLTDAQGNFLTRPVNWSSNADFIATIDDDGVVTGVAKGTAQITAMVEGKQAQMTMNVQEPVASIAVVPPEFDLELGTVRALLVTLSDKDGAALSGRVITFRTSDASVATVSVGGAVVPVKEGTATITAESEGKSATSAVTVVKSRVKSVVIDPPGPQTLITLQTLQLTAELRDASGTIVTGRTVTWTSSNNTVATVSATGLVTAKLPGQVQITARCEDGQAAIGVQVVLPVPGTAGGASSAGAAAPGTGTR